MGQLFFDQPIHTSKCPSDCLSLQGYLQLHRSCNTPRALGSNSYTLRMHGVLVALRALVLAQLIFAQEPAWNRYQTILFDVSLCLRHRLQSMDGPAFDIGRVVNQPWKLVLPLWSERLPMATSLRWRWRTGITGLPGFSCRRRSGRVKKMCYFPLLSHGLTLIACSGWSQAHATHVFWRMSTFMIFNPGAAPCIYYAAGNTAYIRKIQFSLSIYILIQP